MHFREKQWVVAAGTYIPGAHSPSPLQQQWHKVGTSYTPGYVDWV